MTAAPSTSRRGFTLIELLMVILLVGALAALLLVAISAAMRRAQDAAVQAEIDQMATAIENFKNENGAYPTTLGRTLQDTIGSIPTAQMQRLLRNVATMFPRYTGSADQLYQDINDGTLYHPLATGGTGLQWSDLDPAESLVFWLGGFPDPNSETKLIGFRNDPANPFRYWPVGGTAPAKTDPIYLKNRTPSLFQFDPQRLVDRDGDGWWEYIQRGTADGDMPPYVYFDSNTYNLRPFYPQSAMPSANNATWGNLIPYAMADTQKQFASGNPKVLWANSQKFQIIAPGRDGSYGHTMKINTGSAPYDITDTASQSKINEETRLWPSCNLLLINPTAGDVPTSLPDTELDNVTNFSEGRLGDSRE